MNLATVLFRSSGVEVGVSASDAGVAGRLTLRLLMSCMYMEFLVKPEMLTSYIYGPTFGNAETVSFYLLHNVSTLNQCREVSCVALCVNTLPASWQSVYTQM